MISLAIFMVVMVGGGVTFIDDKARGLHEGYLVTPVTKLELISLMFLVLVRASNPIFPRAVIGMLNTILYFPSGAVYPQTAFPQWMQALAAVDPFTYSVHAFRVVLLKNAGMTAIAVDLAFLAAFTVVTTVAAAALFRRSL